MVQQISEHQDEPDVQSDNSDVTNVIDEASQDDTVIPERYDISSYGADYDVDGVVRRLNRGDIFIPDFQRDYVWSLHEASRFIESLLLGLPVPGVFLAQDQQTNKFLVIDGQQRLKSLQFFYEGVFNPKVEEKKQRVFALTKVQEKFEGLTYEALDERDRIKLDNSIIHATVVKQETPQDDDTSVYHIFERLNNGGRKLTPQEIRTALYHGTFIDRIKNLNDYPSWRQIYGKKSNRLKDQELILRFLALYFNGDSYQSPMVEFLNKFAKRHQLAEQDFLNEAERIFTVTIDVMWQTFNSKAFRPERALNAAVFDSIMVGLAQRMRDNPNIDMDKLRSSYANLLNDHDYLRVISRATSNENSVAARLTMAQQAFATI
jgi:hypothetical protein